MILEKIAADTGVSIAQLRAIVQTASHLYKTYLIPKRTGGYRQISHPTPALKFLQRWVSRHVTSLLPIHEAANAYRKELGIRDVARAHANQAYLMRLDFRDFFPSLTGDDIRAFLRDYTNRGLISFPMSDMDVFVRIVCRQNCLTIGAPSSPMLSNALMYGIDGNISNYCKNLGIVYNRYADDLFFSTDNPNILLGAKGRVEGILQECSHPKLTINEQKTVFTSRKRKKMITGLVISPGGGISIGRDKKKIHKAPTTRVYFRPRRREAGHIFGRLSFVCSRGRARIH